MDLDIELNGANEQEESCISPIKRTSYIDILQGCNKLISFDISVRSTGWFKYDNGVCSCGTYTLVSEDLQGRRVEFREFIKKVIGNETFDYVVIEDVIAGTNFRTTQGLIQLNTIVDDMMFYGVIPESPVLRVGNTKWKKYLRKIGNPNIAIRGIKDKEEIKMHVQYLGFCEDVKQDIYDALGMALGVLATKMGLVSERVKLTNKVENNIMQFKVKVFDYEVEAIKYATKIATNNNVPVKYLYDKDIEVSLKDTVKKIVDTEGEDFVFCVGATTFKLGMVGVKFNVYDGQYIVARNKNLVVNKRKAK